MLHVLFTPLPFPVNQNWICEQITLSSFSTNVMFFYIVLVFTYNLLHADEINFFPKNKWKGNVSIIQGMLRVTRSRFYSWKAYETLS